MRTYRVVKMTHGDRPGIWAVVSISIRDDDTWDVIATFRSQSEAWEYVVEVTDRNKAIA